MTRETPEAYAQRRANETRRAYLVTMQGHAWVARTPELARLIAAVPDLLAACEMLVSGAAIGTDAWPAILAAQVAIAKARGE